MSCTRSTNNTRNKRKRTKKTKGAIYKRNTLKRNKFCHLGTPWSKQSQAKPEPKVYENEKQKHTIASTPNYLQNNPQQTSTNDNKNHQQEGANSKNQSRPANSNPKSTTSSPEKTELGWQQQQKAQNSRFLSAAKNL